MKKLLNDVADVTIEQLRGFEAAHPDLVRVHYDPNYICRADAPVGGKVALVSGGGSGHEPLHGGYVGRGMLDAACPGQVFTSPTPDQMFEAGKAVSAGAGVLNIVKNYTGDVLNFQMAADMLREESIEVRNVIIDDDVAVKDSLYTAGRRGLGTTVICEKVCGAAAEAKMPLDKLMELAKKVNRRGKSMGLALTSCITPAKGSPTFDLEDDKIEIGIGIHGEPGSERTGMMSADELTERLAKQIFEDRNYTRALAEWDTKRGEWVETETANEDLSRGDRAIVIVNGMGGTPLSELYTIYGALHKIAERYGVTIERKMIGNWITAIEMQGCSITVVKADKEILDYFDAPVLTPALRWKI